MKTEDKKQSVILLWGPVILWYSIMFYLSHQPNLNSGLAYDFLLRKCAHIFEFAVLSLLIFNAIWKSNYFKEKKDLRLSYSIMTVFIVSLSLAASDEIHQSFVRGRHGTYTDVMIDSIGIMLSCLVLKMRHLKSFNKIS
ncbi:MAG: hypothetical protein D6734_11695 [Candidatus Schekmanbacteria bacterium]|nr:MAG: hypothetical protein D6734_11695 [Candidatus Schekmanbacteria bacterium]